MPLVDDRYELLEVIASGGMATVWRARDTRLGRLVAVKRPHPAAPDDNSAVDRMNREARAAAALSHPNLITVYDYGSDEEGPYLVMELADGPTLQSAMDRLEAGEALGIGAQIADGLTAIHAAGIIHRDVKPANVILSDRGPLLTDFGIAVGPAHTAGVTAEGMVVGTPSYVAPEVMAGAPPSQASDVYSLAVLVREMLEAADTAPTGALADALGAGTASALELRPDARTFGAILRGEAPTVVLARSEPAPSTEPGGSDSTLVMEVPASSSSPDESGDPERGRRFRLPVLLSAVLVLLVALALAFRGADEPGLAEAPTPSTTEVATPLGPTTTTLVPTSTTLAETTSTIASTDPVQELRDDIEGILLQPPRSDLNQRDVAKLMDHIDKAIEKARAGDSEKAVDEFEKVAEELDKKLEEGDRDAALTELQRLTESLGLSVDMPDDGR